MELETKSRSDNESDSEVFLSTELIEPGPLSFRQKIGYGVSDFSSKTFDTIQGFYFNA